MLDISFFEVLAFIRQVSGALAGAGGLHAWLLFNHRHRQLSRTIEPLMIGGSAVYLLSWAIGFVGYSLAEAHVGISVEPTINDVARSFAWQWPLVIALLALLGTSRRGLTRTPRLYYFLYFAATSLLISTYAISDQLDLRQVSYVWHGWHSILTLGTVLVLDYLFFVCRNRRPLLAKLTESFGRFTVFILAGLAIDIMSTYLILGEALRLNTRFYFMQTVVGILLINGIVLSGPLARRATVYLKKQRAMPPLLQAIMGLLGAISFVSWHTITFLDFVPNISLSSASLSVIYATLIAVGFFTHLASLGRARFS